MNFHFRKVFAPLSAVREKSISHTDLTVNIIDGEKHVSDRRAIRHARGVKNLDVAGRPTAGENHTYLNVTTASIATYKITRVGAIVRTKYARRIKNILIVLLYSSYRQ